MFRRKKKESIQPPLYKITTWYDVWKNETMHQIEKYQELKFPGMFFGYRDYSYYSSIYSGTKNQCEVRLKRLIKDAEKK